MKACEHLVNGRTRCRMPDGHYGMHNSAPLVSYLAPVPVSAQRRRDWRTYRRLRREFLESHPRCVFPGGCAQPATEVHHRKGRIGALLLDEAHWSPLCHAHHAYVTEHPAFAYETGMSERRVGAA